MAYFCHNVKYTWKIYRSVFYLVLTKKGMYFKRAFLITKKEQCLKYVAHTRSWDSYCEWAAAGSALILGVMTGQQSRSSAPGDP